MPTTKSIKERFFKHVEKQHNGCWIWIGGEDDSRYGRIGFKGKRIKAHRLSWIIHNGEIPEGMCVCHKCDVPRCTNPEHLFLGTHQDNMKDMAKKGRGPKTNGKNNPRARLTEEQVKEIRGLYKANWISLGKLAKKYAVGKTTIGHIVHNRSWKQVEG